MSGKTHGACDYKEVLLSSALLFVRTKEEGEILRVVERVPCRVAKAGLDLGNLAFDCARSESAGHRKKEDR
jgi:hypothetical protein